MIQPDKRRKIPLNGFRANRLNEEIKNAVHLLPHMIDAHISDFSH